MVNHCVNILRLEKRDKKNLKKVLKDFLNSGQELNFNKVIEMPADLRNSMRPLERACENPKSTTKYLKKLENEIRNQNLEDWGYETPEDWARENWGPEYNCYNFHWDEDKNSAVFDTATDPPLHVIAEIAQKTKQNFLLFYAEPGEKKYGELRVDLNGECSFQSYTEKTAPEEFHNEFPKDYPPNSKEDQKNKTKKVTKKEEQKNAYFPVDFSP
jgi:hypothetical protein